MSEKGIPEEEESLELRIRNSQNRIVGILLLFVLAVLLVLTLADDLSSQFNYLVLAFFAINSVYLGIEVVRYLRLRRTHNYRIGM